MKGKPLSDGERSADARRLSPCIFGWPVAGRAALGGERCAQVLLSRALLCVCLVVAGLQCRRPVPVAVDEAAVLVRRAARKREYCLLSGMWTLCVCLCVLCVCVRVCTHRRRRPFSIQVCVCVHSCKPARGRVKVKHASVLVNLYCVNHPPKHSCLEQQSFS